jgi:hypothetical protein
VAVDIASAGWSAYQAYEECKQGDKDPREPTGRKGCPLNVGPGTNEPCVINGRPYSGHAVDKTQREGITPSVVENAIEYGEDTVGSAVTRYYDPGNNVSVIVANDSGVVVTVSRGKLGNPR